VLVGASCAGCGPDGLLGAEFRASDAVVVEGGPSTGDAAAGADAGDAASVVDADAASIDAGDAADAHDAALDADAGQPEACAPLAHSNGLGQTYESCDPLGTMNYEEAYAACGAWSGSIGFCSPNSHCGAPQTMAQSICSIQDGGCSCWDFAGPSAAHAHQGADCSECVLLTDPSWN